jgi:hypothetical protein
MGFMFAFLEGRGKRGRGEGDGLAIVAWSLEVGCFLDPEFGFWYA